MKSRVGKLFFGTCRSGNAFGIVVSDNETINGDNKYRMKLHLLDFDEDWGSDGIWPVLEEIKSEDDFVIKWKDNDDL